jgi:hypothetical protein
MKCIPACGFNQKPENLNTLKEHARLCSMHGALKDYQEAYGIIWKNNELLVSFTADSTEQVLDGSPAVAAPKAAAKKKTAAKK